MDALADHGAFSILTSRSRIRAAPGKEIPSMSRVADPKAKNTLLRAAEAVFAERGLVNAKVEEIAKRAGLSKGAFYLHFDSKEAALKHVVEGFLARCGSFFAPPSAYPELPEDAIAMLDYCLERDHRIFEFLWESRPILRILATCQGQYDYLVESFNDGIDRTTREWVDWWKLEGYYRPDVDAVLTTHLVHGAYNALVERMLRSEAKPPLAAWLAYAQEMMVRAFGTPELIRAFEARNRPVDTGIEGGDGGKVRAAVRRRGPLGAGEERSDGQ
jgi:AcrR family transcriptional regulator